jgi:hypothetical protein
MSKVHENTKSKIGGKRKMMKNETVGSLSLPLSCAAIAVEPKD